MAINDHITASQAEIAAWRRHLHTHPELLYDVPETAAFVADKLASFGCDTVATGIGGTGVVGLIHGREGGEGRTVGLRADMDALPIEEETGLSYASTQAGKMHACGHDGHMAMLLGAARVLAETRRFAGTVAVVFQPAEEGGAGAKAMIDDGLLDRFPMTELYGMHNLPGLAVGRFAIRPGPIMASTDEFSITIEGRGGHAAMPHTTMDPIAIGAAMVQSLQMIVSRSANPLDSLVVSVTQFHAGFVHNVIPEKAVLSGTVRALTEPMRELAEARIRQIAESTAAAHGARALVDYDRNYPVTRNEPQATSFCTEVAAAVAGADNVDVDAPPLMGGEDFAYMLEERPGAFIFVGNGDSAGLHHPRYDFNDEAIAFGASYWIALAEGALGR
ncbi:M20 aminoacylase family protein [Consotaella aegiceratis]|uniref:M20 aminoacylase family protein n=1 Tax=Consotaella aegiceratis TaxID=3097961 RepID=UPI002F40B242